MSSAGYILRNKVLIIILFMAILLSIPNAYLFDQQGFTIIQILPTEEKYNGITATSTWRKPYDTVSIGNASIDPCLWGLDNYGYEVDGESKGSLINGTLLYSTTLYFTKNNLKPWNVIGYNEIIYGLKPWGMPSTHKIPQLFKLPVMVEKLLNKHVLLYVDYNILSINTGIDLSYDIWFKRYNITNGVSSGDAELMIWLYRKDVKPAGKVEGVFVYPLVVNGKLINTTWEVYVAENMGSGWIYIAVIPEVQAKRGNVLLDLTGLLVKVNDFYTKHNIDLLNMYMMDIEFGMEIFYNRYISVQWILYKYFILLTSGKNTELLKDAWNILNNTPRTIMPTRRTMHTTAITATTINSTTMATNNTASFKITTKAPLTTILLTLIISISMILIMLILYRLKSGIS